MSALTLRNLQKTYPGGVHALDGIDLEVQPGEFFALLGPNGAGKSTIIGIISTLVRKTSGSVNIFGYDLDAQRWQAKSQIGLVPQEFNFNGFETVGHVVLNQAGYYGLPRRQARERAERYLRELGLWSRRNTVTRTLSGGMKRRLMIARALIHEPRLLILDEPTAGVDIELRRSMWEFLNRINEQGTTIILTTHYLEEAESLCRNIAIIDQGRIVENTNIRSLLRSLNTESFILDIAGNVRDMPTVEGFHLVPVDESSLEVSINAEQTLNGLFRALDRAGIEVTSMRNKANRLEELFVQLVEDNTDAKGTAEGFPSAPV